MSTAEAKPHMASINGATEAERRMKAVLDAQRQAHLKDGPPSAKKRIEWLDRAIELLVAHKDAIADALREDFGHRSVEATLLTERCPKSSRSASAMASL